MAVIDMDIKIDVNFVKLILYNPAPTLFPRPFVACVFHGHTFELLFPNAYCTHLQQEAPHPILDDTLLSTPLHQTRILPPSHSLTPPTNPVFILPFHSTT